MKAHTTGFKNAVKELGRQLRVVITYGNVTLEEEIYAVTPHFEGGILKSIMKQLDLELSVDIPLETVLNCRIGILVNGSYEMLNYGNYVVYKSEKQEDTNTYKLTCYDKILYSMKQNEDLGITYPISIKNYLKAVLRKLGLTLKTTTFRNESRMIQNELYLGLDYTYRDILDEIAQATGSIICLNENDEVTVKYPTKTNDTIDEEFLKDVNVDFGQMYGAINTIVLSRSGESDNIYYPETLPENPIEIKIKDNQIMNWNDRSDYLQGIYNALNGLYYYINDFSSTGILYYEVGDLYNIRVGNNTYQCLMLNDEINITTGIEEIIHTDLPEQSKTDYTKADKTDRRINQTYLIVDKQNHQIESVVKQTIDPDNPNSISNKLSKVTQTVSELSSQIKDVADITTSLETMSAKLEFENINQSEPIRVVIHPIGTNIAKLHPHPNLKPKVGLKMTTRILRFQNTTTNEIFDYELPDDLLYYDSEHYDEFQLDYEAQTCIINKKCKWNADGTVGLLPSERAVEYEYPHIELTEGDYTVSLIKYSNGYLFARMMIKNYYTAQFATRVELHSDIKQTVDNINLSVGKKLEGYSTTTEMNSAIDVKANAITQSVSENYATKTALGNTETSLKSEIKSTAEAITTRVSETYVTNTTLTSKYSTTEATKNMINLTVGEKTKNNLETVTVEYALGTSTTTAPTSGWSTTAPTWQQGKYMWQRTKTKTADGKENISNPTCIAGANGVSLSSITEYYAVSSSNTSAPADSAFKTTMQTMTTTNKYLWNYEIMTFSDNSEQSTIKRVIGTYGDKGIGITSVANKYQVSNSNTTAPTTWKDTPQTMTATNKYLWNYEIITYSNGTTSTSTPAVIGTYGEKGDKGNTGDTGKGVKAVVAQYYLSSSKTTQTGGSWAETQPAYKKDHYYWTRTKITWTDNTTTYTTPILVEEINSLNESVATLEITTKGIATEVSKKVGSSEIISKINQSAEAVTINANKLGLTANNIFNIISGNELNLTSKNITIKSTNFNVDKNGNMSCNNATVSGKITATSGTIGGFSVVGNADDNRRLRSNNKKVGMSSSTHDGDPSFWAGNTDPWEDSNWKTNTPFYVTNQGYLKASSGSIGGWTINSASLSKSTTNYVTEISANAQAGDATFMVWDRSNDRANWYVRTDGYMYARNADISGTITATSGTFENCTIKNSCNIPASAIKSGTMDASRISGGRLNVSSVSAVSVGADAIGVTTGGAYTVGDWTGENFQLIVQHEGQYWRRLTFKGGILVNVESSW